MAVAGQPSDVPSRLFSDPLESPFSFSNILQPNISKNNKIGAESVTILCNL